MSGTNGSRLSAAALRRHGPWSALLIGAAAMLSWAGSTSAGQAPSPGQALFDPSAVRKQQLERWDEFNAAHGGRWRVVWNPRTGTPHRISGYHLELPVKQPAQSAAAAEKQARAFLGEQEELLQVGERDLAVVAIDRDAGQGQAGVASWYVSYRQTYQGLPVAGSSVRVAMRGRKLVAFGADAFPHRSSSTARPR